MNKARGKFIIEWYDNHGSKKGSCECTSYLHGESIAKFWESLSPGNSAVVSRILYNTHSNNYKWSYTP